MKFAVDFDGWFEVEAEDSNAAFTKVFNLLNDVLSPHCNGGHSGDWEVINVVEAD